MVAEMARLRDNGLTLRAIAEQLGISTTTVGHHLGRRRRLRRVTVSEEQFALEHLRDGWSVSAIAEALGRTTSTIIKIGNRNGVTSAISRGEFGGARSAPRIVPNGRDPGLDPGTVQTIVSAARKTGTIAGAAREAGVTPALAERVLRRNAPHVYWAFVERNALDIGGQIERAAGTVVRLFGWWRTVGLDTKAGYDTVVVDHGEAKVREWLERLEQDRQAIRDLSRELRAALARAEAARGSPPA
jgi:hypothetical protein